ncbi:hypothetical protein INS49_001220 [Diaporthe citri]|uniref:uncharacterized protein n=1 Tax=Diaporthe citri TaxID=83186 RepID=UPI001C80A565|nr:uncharacterized protein INS49_001220 [Diaporthe citri]KAG6367038.1 hypothetical protein INS49_001220 [Diaporthe citri]
MDANSQNCGDEVTPSKKHAIEQSPRKQPPKKPMVEQHSQGPTNFRTGDKLDNVTNTVATLETRVTRLETGGQKRSDFLRRKLEDQHTFLISEIDKKLDQDAAMTDKEHEELITDVTEMATRAYLRKVLERKVKRIVKDVIEGVLEEVVDEVMEDLVYRKLKERDAAIKGMLETKADQDELDEVDDELAAARRMLEEQRRQIVAILDWIRNRS